MKFFTKDFDGHEVYRGAECPNVILFHGFGASSDDLFTLHEMMDPEEKCNWFFPQGILSIPVSPYWEGKAWWTIDMRRLQAAGKPVWDYDQETPSGLKSASLHAENILEAVKGKPVILGGFSQGAMLAADTATKLPVQGLILFSGALIAAPLWQENLSKNKTQNENLRFFQSHGQQDQVLPLDAGAKLHRFLTETAGWKGQLQRFTGGHEIPMPVLTNATAYLSSRVKEL